MRSFKDFLKTEAGINPGLGQTDFQMPTNMSIMTPHSFQDLAAKNNLYDNPKYVTLSKIGQYCQNVISHPTLYGIQQQNISGINAHGGYIHGLNYSQLESASGRGATKFTPQELSYAISYGIFVPNPPNSDPPTTIDINLNALYYTAKTTLKVNSIQDLFARGADSTLNNASTPGNNTQALQRAQYGV